MFVLTEKDLYQSSQTDVPVRLDYSIHGEMENSAEVSGWVRPVPEL